jgi:hypothetical protein
MRHLGQHEWVGGGCKQAERPMDNGIWRRESHLWLRWGGSHASTVGALQTLARQTAPTALAPVYHLTALNFAAAGEK